MDKFEIYFFYNLKRIWCILSYSKKNEIFTKYLLKECAQAYLVAFYIYQTLKKNFFFINFNTKIKTQFKIKWNGKNK